LWLWQYWALLPSLFCGDRDLLPFAMNADDRKRPKGNQSSTRNAGRNSQCHPSRFISTAATARSSTSSAGKLATVPGYSHYNFVSATELAAIIDKYLADPLTNAPPARQSPPRQRPS